MEFSWAWDPGATGAIATAGAITASAAVEEEATAADVKTIADVARRKDELTAEVAPSVAATEADPIMAGQQRVAALPAVAVAADRMAAEPMLTPVDRTVVVDRTAVADRMVVADRMAAANVPAGSCRTWRLM